MLFHKLVTGAAQHHLCALGRIGESRAANPSGTLLYDTHGSCGSYTCYEQMLSLSPNYQISLAVAG